MSPYLLNKHKTNPETLSVIIMREVKLIVYLCSRLLLVCALRSLCLNCFLIGGCVLLSPPDWMLELRFPCLLTAGCWFAFCRLLLLDVQLVATATAMPSPELLLGLSQVVLT